MIKYVKNITKPMKSGTGGKLDNGEGIDAVGKFSRQKARGEILVGASVIEREGPPGGYSGIDSDGGFIPVALKATVDEIRGSDGRNGSTSSYSKAQEEYAAQEYRRMMEEERQRQERIEYFNREVDGVNIWIAIRNRDLDVLLKLHEEARSDSDKITIENAIFEAACSVAHYEAVYAYFSKHQSRAYWKPEERADSSTLSGPFFSRGMSWNGEVLAKNRLLGAAVRERDVEVLLRLRKLVSSYQDREEIDRHLREIQGNQGKPNFGGYLPLLLIINMSLASTIPEKPINKTMEQRRESRDMRIIDRHTSSTQSINDGDKGCLDAELISQKINPCAMRGNSRCISRVQNKTKNRILKQRIAIQNLSL